MAIPSYIAFLILGVIAFAISLFFSFKKYKKLKYENYSLKNHFPFELNVDDYFRNNISGNIFFLFSRAMILSLSILYIINNRSGNTFTIGVLLLLSILTSIFSYLTSLRNLKGHIIFQSISSISLFSCLFLMSYNTYGQYHIDKENIISLVLSIFLLFISLSYLVINIIPKNTYNIKFDEINNDGAISYKRPKFIFTCFVEWCSYFLSYIVVFLLTIIQTIK